MPEPMPEIEVNDWFERLDGALLSLHRCFHEDHARNIAEDLRDGLFQVTEVRKANGVVWRREEPIR